MSKGLIAVIASAVLIGLAGTGAYLLRESPEKTLYSGSFPNSEGGTVHAEIRLMDDYLMKEQLVLTDDKGITVNYSVKGEDESVLPKDMISRRTDDATVVWVLDKDGTEFIEVEGIDTDGKRLYERLSPEKGSANADSYTAKAAERAEKCGFPRELPESCDKKAWNIYFSEIYEKADKKDNEDR